VRRGGKVVLERGNTIGPRQVDGTHRVDQECLDCGRCRWKLTGPGGRFHHGGQWQYYGGPDDFYQPGLTKADFRGESERRLLEAFAEAGHLAALPAEVRGRRAEAVDRLRDPFKPAAG
jgi:hypothetical protein